MVYALNGVVVRIVNSLTKECWNGKCVRSRSHDATNLSTIFISDFNENCGSSNRSRVYLDETKRNQKQLFTADNSVVTRIQLHKEFDVWMWTFRWLVTLMCVSKCINKIYMVVELNMLLFINQLVVVVVPSLSNRKRARECHTGATADLIILYANGKYDDDNNYGWWWSIYDAYLPR